MKMVRTEPRQNHLLVSDVFERFVFELLGGVFRILGAVARWTVIFPALSVPIFGCGVVTYRWGLSAGIGAVILCAVLFAVWRFAWPRGFQRRVSGRIRVRWRGWSRYQRPWEQTCALHGLTNVLNDEVLLPQLKRIVIGSGIDALTVRTLPGQSTTDWQKQAEALAHAFGAQLVRVRPLQPGWVEIEVQRTDPAVICCTAAPAVREPDPAAVHVGVRENGSPWFARLAGRHLLVAGATGAGKGGVTWSLLAGIGPAIRDGLVQVWVIDPKGGMEFGAGHDLFSRFAYDTGEATLALLRDAAAVYMSAPNGFAVFRANTSRVSTSRCCSS